MKGLLEIEQIYQNRSTIAEELRNGGKKIIGYFCCLTPVEILTAADLVPYRIMGDVEKDITKADGYIEVIAYPHIRSCLNLALRGKYDFLDGFVLPHACDNVVLDFPVPKPAL